MASQFFYSFPCHTFSKNLSHVTPSPFQNISSGVSLFEVNALRRHTKPFYAGHFIFDTYLKNKCFQCHTIRIIFLMSHQTSHLNILFVQIAHRFELMFAKSHQVKKCLPVSHRTKKCFLVSLGIQKTPVVLSLPWFLFPSMRSTTSKRSTNEALPV